jgi:hypothetical protein
MKSLAEMFPNASQSTVAANPALVPTVALPLTKRGKMNKTEAEFALRLEAQKRNGDILRYEYEGITLRWADMRYTPDFVVFTTQAPTYSFKAFEIKLIEVKGPHIWDRDTVRFKGARAFWPEFAFEMWQKTKSGWKQKF